MTVPRLYHGHTMAVPRLYNSWLNSGHQPPKVHNIFTEYVMVTKWGVLGIPMCSRSRCARGPDWDFLGDGPVCKSFFVNVPI